MAIAHAPAKKKSVKRYLIFLQIIKTQATNCSNKEQFGVGMFDIHMHTIHFWTNNSKIKVPSNKYSHTQIPSNKSVKI